jgi:hypothetical protein
MLKFLAIINKMEAKIIIKFKKINGVKVDDKLMDSELGYRLLGTTEKTVKKLTKSIKDYLGDNKIMVVVGFEVFKNGR